MVRPNNNMPEIFGILSAELKGYTDAAGGGLEDGSRGGESGVGAAQPDAARSELCEGRRVVRRSK